MAVPVAAVVAVASAAEHQVEGAVKTLYDLSTQSTEQGLNDAKGTAERGVSDGTRIAREWGKSAEKTREISQEVTV